MNSNKYILRTFSFILLSGFTAFVSCRDTIVKKETSVKENSTVDSISKTEVIENPKTGSINLVHFKGLPDDIEGCSCYFSVTKAQFDKQEYLYAANYDSTAYISVNNQLIKLQLVSSNRERGDFEGDYIKDIFANDTYKVTVELKFKNQNGDETNWFEGTITVEDKNGNKKTEKIVGECGC